MRNFSYEFWRDFATIISYFLIAFAFITPHVITNKFFTAFVGIFGVTGITFCAIQMIIAENKKLKEK